MKTAPGTNRMRGGSIVLKLNEDDHNRKGRLRLALLKEVAAGELRDDVPAVPPFDVRYAAVGRIRSLQDWILEHPSQDLTVRTLAAYTGLGVRHFMRVFRQVSGMTPGEFVDRARVNAARLLLADTDLLQRQVAVLCGFSNSDVMRLAFMRTTGEAPRQYRLRSRESALLTPPMRTQSPQH